MHSEREFIHAGHASCALMPPFLLRAERGGRMGVGGGLKEKTRITTKARCTHLLRHSELLQVLCRECLGALLRCVDNYNYEHDAAFRSRPLSNGEWRPSEACSHRARRT